jgi:putative transposase
LKAARNAISPTVPWQRCQFHLQQNAQHYVPRQRTKQEIAERIRTIFAAPDDQEAVRLLKIFLDDYRKDAPDLVNWAELAIPEELVMLTMPKKPQQRLRTVSMLERLNKELLRRTRVATLFPNTESCLRLVTAVAMEISDEWQAGKVYLSME